MRRSLGDAQRATKVRGEPVALPGGGRSFLGEAPGAARTVAFIGQVIGDRRR